MTIHRRRLTARNALTVCLIAGALSGNALAAGSGSHEHHEHKIEWGAPAEADNVSRTIEVEMGDIWFKPESINIKAGETVRFVVTNSGQLIHEFNIGTSHTHAEHKKEMADMMAHGAMTATHLNHDKMEHGGMKHDDPNSVLLETGQQAELIWTFSKPVELEFACNVPGHYEAGMVGPLTVRN